ncbi:uncharacterized protein LOC144717916 isoform X2 [Lampetra planeri]
MTTGRLRSSTRERVSRKAMDGTTERTAAHRPVKSALKQGTPRHALLPPRRVGFNLARTQIFYVPRDQPVTPLARPLQEYIRQVYPSYALPSSTLRAWGERIGPLSASASLSAIRPSTTQWAPLSSSGTFRPASSTFASLQRGRERMRGDNKRMNYDDMAIIARGYKPMLSRSCENVSSSRSDGDNEVKSVLSEDLVKKELLLGSSLWDLRSAPFRRSISTGVSSFPGFSRGLNQHSRITSSGQLALHSDASSTFLDSQFSVADLLTRRDLTFAAFVDRTSATGRPGLRSELVNTQCQVGHLTPRRHQLSFNTWT